MKSIRTICVALLLTAAIIFSGCRQTLKTTSAAAKQPQPVAEATTPPCRPSSSPSLPTYSHHSEWELPGAAVPEVYAAAKTVLIENWKMPDSSGNRSENQSVDFLSAYIKVTSALDTSFELAVTKINEDSCRLAIDAQSRRIQPAQLEDHCSLMYDNIIQYLNTQPRDSQKKKEIWNSSQKMYAIGDYKFDYPVKNVFDSANGLLEQMNVSRSNSRYDDFAGQIFFTTGNNYEMAIDVQMTDENKCLLTFFSRNRTDKITEKWSDIFARRLQQKLAELPAAAAALTAESKPAKNTYYGHNNRVWKDTEYPYTVEQIYNAVTKTLTRLDINNLDGTPQRDALNAKLGFITANSAKWRVTISQIAPDQSKLSISATDIYSQEFEKYTAAILQHLENQLKPPAEPAS